MTAWGTLELAVSAMKRARRLRAEAVGHSALVQALRNQIGSAPRAAQDLELARRVRVELLRSASARMRHARAARALPAGGRGRRRRLRLPGGRAGTHGRRVGGRRRKGVSAALLMANLIGCLRSHAASAGEDLPPRCVP
jgi:hypothetical protein